MIAVAVTRFARDAGWTTFLSTQVRVDRPRLGDAWQRARRGGRISLALRLGNGIRSGGEVSCIDRDVRPGRSPDAVTRRRRDSDRPRSGLRILQLRPVHTVVSQCGGGCAMKGRRSRQASWMEPRLPAVAQDVHGGLAPYGERCPAFAVAGRSAALSRRTPCDVVFPSEHATNERACDQYSPVYPRAPFAVRPAVPPAGQGVFPNARAPQLPTIKP